MRWGAPCYRSRSWLHPWFRIPSYHCYQRLFSLFQIPTLTSCISRVLQSRNLEPYLCMQVILLLLEYSSVTITSAVISNCAGVTTSLGQAYTTVINASCVSQRRMRRVG